MVNSKNKYGGNSRKMLVYVEFLYFMKLGFQEMIEWEKIWKQIFKPAPWSADWDPNTHK